MAEAHPRDVRDDQDRRQGQQACMVLPNVTVLISFFPTEDNKKNIDSQGEIPFSVSKYKAGTLPLNMYQTAVHRGERLEFAPVERVEQPEFSKEEGREGAPTSRDPGDDQLFEYDDDSSDNDSDDFAVEKDGAIHDVQNPELGFF